MPSPKTVGTELAVGFGLLNIDPLAITPVEATERFGRRLTPVVLDKLKNNFQENSSYYQRFINIGTCLRNRQPSFANVTSVNWEGPRQPTRTVSMAKDIVAANTSISVKAESNIVYNFSPYNLFVSIPTGLPELRGSPNWYHIHSPDKHQALYSYIRNRWFPEHPEDVTVYSTRRVKRKAKEDLADFLGELPDNESSRVKELYLDMCHDVAQKSADAFNESLGASLRSNIRDTVKRNIIRKFFRIGDNDYVLCGLDRKNVFAILVPSLSTWDEQWRFKSLEATPDLTKGQSIVRFNLVITNKATREDHTISYDVQIRWSKGKFVQMPEAKLYKNFGWTEIPFATKIIDSTSFERLYAFGDGGFGIVYEAISKQTRERVAIKELKLQQIHERPRFEREVSLQASLDHPNILPVTHADLADSPPWFVTPLALGNIADHIVELQRDPAQVTSVFSQILAGVQFAHSQKAIHRDLKPENVLLFSGNHVKIGDFGLGKWLDPELQDSFITNSGESWGTLCYASPEQIESFDKADERSDIYALGKILYFLATGNQPSTFYSELGNLPTRYMQIITKCTQRDPNARYQTIGELITAFKVVC